MTALRVLFVGTGATNSGNLWVTDGTSSGTSELTFAGGAGVRPFDITAFGTKALFDGSDASGHPQLWVTDGTAAGTSELTVAGADPFGLLLGGSPDFTVLGSKALFAGTGASSGL